MFNEFEGTHVNSGARSAGSDERQGVQGESVRYSGGMSRGTGDLDPLGMFLELNIPSDVMEM